MGGKWTRAAADHPENPKVSSPLGCRRKTHSPRSRRFLPTCPTWRARCVAGAEIRYASKIRAAWLDLTFGPLSLSPSTRGHITGWRRLTFILRAPIARYVSDVFPFRRPRKRTHERDWPPRVFGRSFRLWNGHEPPAMSGTRTAPQPYGLDHRPPPPDQWRQNDYDRGFSRSQGTWYNGHPFLAEFGKGPHGPVKTGDRPCRPTNQEDRTSATDQWNGARSIISSRGAELDETEPPHPSHPTSNRLGRTRRRRA